MDSAAMADTTPGQPDDGSQRGSGHGTEPAGAASARPGGGSRRVRQYRPSRWRHVGDAIIGCNTPWTVQRISEAARLQLGLL